MTTPFELNAAPSTDLHAAESHLDGFSIDMSSRDDADDGVYEEISERRAQLENAAILRGARAL
jgi:hypothetical protein